MNIKHIIFFDIKIETKQKKKTWKKRGKLKVKEKQYWKQKIPKHIQMITTDATVSKMEKMKKSDEKKNHWKITKKNCKTNLKIKTKNRSTPSKLRKDLKIHNQSDEEKKTQTR